MGVPWGLFLGLFLPLVCHAVPSVVKAPRCFDCHYSPDSPRGEGYGGYHTCALNTVTDLNDVDQWRCASGKCFIRRDHNGLVYRGCADSWNLPWGVTPSTEHNCHNQGSRGSLWWFCDGDLCNDGNINAEDRCGLNTEPEVAASNYNPEPPQPEQYNPYPDPAEQQPVPQPYDGYLDTEPQQGGYPEPELYRPNDDVNLEVEPGFGYYNPAPVDLVPGPLAPNFSPSKSYIEETVYGDDNFNPNAPKAPAPKTSGSEEEGYHKTYEGQARYDTYKSHQPDKEVRTYKSHQPVKSHEPVKTHEPYKTHEPIKSHEPVKSDQPVKTHLPGKSHEPPKSYVSPKIFVPYKSHPPVKSRDQPKSYDPKKSHDPPKSYDPKKSYDPPKTYDPKKSYDSPKSYDPKKSYDQPKSYDPEKSNDPPKSYDPKKSHDPPKTYDPKKSQEPVKSHVQTKYYAPAFPWDYKSSFTPAKGQPSKQLSSKNTKSSPGYKSAPTKSQPPSYKSQSPPYKKSQPTYKSHELTFSKSKSSTQTYKSHPPSKKSYDPVHEKSEIGYYQDSRPAPGPYGPVDDYSASSYAVSAPGPANEGYRSLSPNHRVYAGIRSDQENIPDTEKEEEEFTTFFIFPDAVNGFRGGSTGGTSNEEEEEEEEQQEPSQYPGYGYGYGDSASTEAESAEYGAHYYESYGNENTAPYRYESGNENSDEGAGQGYGYGTNNYGSETVSAEYYARNLAEAFDYDYITYERPSGYYADGHNPCDTVCDSNPSGLYPDPSRSNGFIQCGDGVENGKTCTCCKPYYHKCPRGTTFDKKSKVCSQLGDSTQEKRVYQPVELEYEY